MVIKWFTQLDKEMTIINIKHVKPRASWLSFVIQSITCRIFHPTQVCTPLCHLRPRWDPISCSQLWALAAGHSSKCLGFRYSLPLMWGSPTWCQARVLTAAPLLLLAVSPLYQLSTLGGAWLLVIPEAAVCLPIHSECILLKPGGCCAHRFCRSSVAACSPAKRQGTGPTLTVPSSPPPVPRDIPLRFPFPVFFRKLGAKFPQFFFAVWGISKYIIEAPCFSHLHWSKRKKI